MRLHHGVAEGRGLLIVVSQHELADLVGHCGQQLVPLGQGQLTVGDRAAEPGS